jgi:hypothetical protein
LRDYWRLAPQWNEVIKAREELGQPGEGEAFVLVLNGELPLDLPYEIVSSYPSSVFILKIRSDVEK